MAALRELRPALERIIFSSSSSSCKSVFGF